MQLIGFSSPDSPALLSPHADTRSLYLSSHTHTSTTALSQTCSRCGHRLFT